MFWNNHLCTKTIILLRIKEYLVNNNVDLVLVNIHDIHPAF